MGYAPRYHGSLVAFEGRAELVSTQLQLLPTSRQVLILPSIQEYLEKEGVREPFDARQFIREVHLAATARHEAALHFLQQSTPKDKRLVFLDGGTANAHALCLSAICENETGGDLARADSIFNGLVSGGVTGLAKDISTWRNSIQTEHQLLVTHIDEQESEGITGQDLAQDPITQAMRAADALDLETEELDPPSRDIDLTINNRLTRSLSLPHLDLNDRFLGANSFMAFAEPSDTSSITTTTATTTPVKGGGMSELLRKRPTRISVATSACRSHAGELYDMSTYPIFSPLTDVFTSPPTTPDKIEIGEAQIIQIEDSPPNNAFRKARSLDRIFLGSEHIKDSINPTLLGFDLSRKSSPTSSEKRSRLKQRPVSCLGTSSLSFTSRSSVNYLEVPKAIFVKASKTTITRSPTRTQSRSSMRATYVDRGVDAPVFVDDGSSGPRNPEELPFEPVLPLVEDLIIQFADESPNELLDFVIHSLKETKFPIIAESDSAVSDDLAAVPATPTSQTSRSTSEKNRISLGAVRHPDAAILDTDEYDPFASHGSYGLPSWTRNETPHAIKTTLLAAMPSAPSSNKPEFNPNKRFCTLSTYAQTAVGLHNSLRSTLDGYLHAEDGYRQSHFPVLPEVGSLWRPIFRQSESQSPKRSKQEKGIDLILAIGAQQGVKKEYSSAITGQLEKLGSKPSGLSRSGRLELRYLIAMVMQQFVAQPPARRARDSPLTNHTLLATLVIQHLELYLAAHPDVRFLLLEYPPEHLSTVLALQKLIGSDIVNVAGILDGEDSEPVAPAHLRPRGSPGKNSDREGRGSVGLQPSSTVSSLTSTQSFSRSTWQPFSRANFLLTSSASDSEIATFISTIWKILISISPYYIPEHAPRKVASQAALPNQGPAKGQNASSAIESTYSYPREHPPPSEKAPISSTASIPPVPAVPPMPPLPQRPPSPIESVRSRPSISISIRSGRSGRSGKTWRTGTSTKNGRLHSIRSRRSRHGRGDRESLFGWLDTDEEDEDFDQEVKRVMPMFLRQRKVQMQKGNSRKALKWLGLA
ncbi:hypothetical protein GQ53DRAFT_816757 [Thozetella sp. PMI_491]|nr:hypothetical protein GQ53DRAFT_816757 [Thozetella sp. PMI_491]